MQAGYYSTNGGGREKAPFGTGREGIDVLGSRFGVFFETKNKEVEVRVGVESSPHAFWDSFFFTLFVYFTV